MPTQPLFDIAAACCSEAVLVSRHVMAAVRDEGHGRFTGGTHLSFNLPMLVV